MATGKQVLLDRLNENRVLNALRTGWEAGIRAYNQEDFVPSIDFGWDDYEARLARYHYNKFYVHNQIYAQVNRFADWYKHKEGLYKHIRGLRNPISRLVNIEVSKIFGGFINYETFKDGALPLSGADETLMEAIRTLWKWSNMAQFKQLLPYEGSSKGDVAIKVIDDVKRQKVYMEVLDACKVKDYALDNLGNVKSVHICYTRYDEDKKREYTYEEIITKEKFATFYNGEPYAFISDENEKPLPEWPNPYGFVPVEWVKHHDIGLKSGAVSFHDARTKIDNLNDVVSLLHDNIRAAVRAKYAIRGASGQRDSAGNLSTISMGTDARDTVPFLTLGENGDIFPIRSELDIVGTLQVVNAQMAEIEKDLPQLALQTMRSDTANTSGVAIENLYSDAEDIIQALQSTYISAVTSATKMALSIAAFRRYDAFRAFNLGSYEAGSLDFDIRPRPVFQDTLSTKENIELTMQAADSPASKLLLQKLGYSEEEIQELENAKADSQSLAMREMFGSVFGGNAGSDMEARAKRLQDDKQEDETPARMEAYKE